MNKIEITAKTIDNALNMAAEQLGVPLDKIEHTVIQEGAKGFLSFLVGKEIIIEAWVKQEQKKNEVKEYGKKVPSSTKKDSARDIKKDSARDTSAKKDSVRDTAAKKDSVRDTAVNNTAKKDIKKDTPKKNPIKSAPHQKNTDKRSRRDSEERSPEQRRVAVVTDEMVDSCKSFLKDLLDKMDIQHELIVTTSDGTIDVEIKGERMGLIIGKRGETLDALQYITNLYMNKDRVGYLKISLDTENYRSKREETLIRLAHGLEHRVIMTKRSITLEPMSPYERRIIHSTLQSNSRIRTYSVGDEPNRKVVVALAR